MQNFSFTQKISKSISPPLLRQSSEVIQSAEQNTFAPKLRTINELSKQFVQNANITNQFKTSEQQQDLSKQLQYESSQEEDDSFYSAYLRVQQEKFQQQLLNLEMINQKLRELDDQLLLPIQIPKERQEIKIQISNTEKEYNGDLLQFAYILGELVTINTCKQNIKLKLRFRLFDILQLFNLNQKKIQRKQFYQNVSKVLGTSSRQYLDTLVKYLFSERQQINRQQFSALFRSNKKETQHNHPGQDTSQLIKEFFSSLCETIYFESKLKKVTQEINIQKIQEVLGNNKSFSSEDIQRFVNQYIKLKLELQNIQDFFTRILKPRRSGDFVVAEFIQWLQRKY